MRSGAPKFRCWRVLVPLLGILLSGAAPVPSPFIGHLELDAASPYVNVTINGIPFRLRVDLDAQGSVVLNPDVARRAKFARGGTVTMNIGPVKFPGRFAPAELAVEARRLPVQVKWFVRNASSDADGIITPALLPFDTVTIIYGTATAPTRRLSFRAKLEDEAGLHVPMSVGRQSLKLRFSPRGDTVATAAAGAVLVRARGGGWDGEERRSEIGYGVSRPVRPLLLGAPLVISGLAVTSVLVRLADFAGKHALPDETGPDAPPDEILVRARRATQEAIYRMTVGQETLGSCSASIVRPASLELMLVCGADAAGEKMGT